MAIEDPKRGVLYLCPTPIGNLKDITERTLEVLKSVDLIAAEDTRNTINLLNHFNIRVPMISYHEYNRYDRADELIKKMESGMDIACVTDAGTPGISDPGEILVKKAAESGIKVVSLPGATAFVTALTVSALPTGRFVFEGFLPKEKKERRYIIDRMVNETATMILYEAPHHLKATLSDLKEALGDGRKIAACRELTKIHEEILRMTIGELAAYYEEREPRGEYVLVIEGRAREEIEREKKKAFEQLSIAEHVQMHMEAGMDKKTAMKRAAEERGVPKRVIYKALIDS
ncbi:MAG: 16S rRNA (cytidine(1402)-2'-O)-methyltransferase [Lachnospiraceae bacterium]|nr:16S rRNA (cytidine(1402)-2'-O)-methyltransferase [Lachnospiraceae bacterium]